MPKASGKFVLRLSPELHERLRSEARARDLSLNELCKALITQDVDSKNSWHSALQKSLEERFGSSSLLGLVAFGSRVRGDAGPESDLDLLIVLDSGFEITRALYSAWDEILSAHPEVVEPKVSPHFVSLPISTREAGGLWFEVALHGKILFAKDHRLEKFLFDLRQLMAESKLKRHMIHGHPYWERFDEE